jgi:hypothetical protein
MAINTAKKAINTQRDMTTMEIAVFKEVMAWIYEDDTSNPHKLWSARWKPHWPKRDGFNVGLSGVQKRKTKSKTSNREANARYGLFQVRDDVTGKWLTYQAHVEAMRHFNKMLDPRLALDQSDAAFLNYDALRDNEHVGLQEIRSAKRHVRHGTGCPYHCVDTSHGHLRYGNHAHNMADRDEKTNAETQLNVPQDIRDIVVALLRQGDGLEAISKRFKLRGWEVRRIADKAGLPEFLSRHDPIDRG